MSNETAWFAFQKGGVLLGSVVAPNSTAARRKANAKWGKQNVHSVSMAPRFWAKKNPGGRKMTKTQRRRNASARAKQKRMTVALRKFLQSVKPGSKATAAAVRKNPGGSITITPIKVSRNGARQRNGPARPRNGYVVYPSSRGFSGLRDANKHAKELSAREGFARVENADNEKNVATWRNGRRA